MRVVIEVPRAPGQLRVVRRFVEAWAAAESTDPGPLPMVATELLTNAMNASPEDAPVILRLEREGHELRLVVVDEGPGFTLGATNLPSTTPPAAVACSWSAVASTRSPWSGSTG